MASRVQQALHGLVAGGSRLGAVASAVLVVCMLAPAAASAAAGAPPQIESVEARTSGEVVVEAEINPEGLATGWVMELACGLCAPAGYKPASGRLAASGGPQRVALDLKGIAYGFYPVEIAAVNSAGFAYAYGQIHVALPVPENKATPFESTPVPWAAENAAEAAQEELERYEAAQRKPREEAQQKQEEAEQRRREEAESQQRQESVRRQTQEELEKQRRQERDELLEARSAVAHVRPGSLEIRGAGMATIRMRCSGDARCGGRARLAVRASGGHGRHHRMRAIGSARFSIGAGDAAVVKVALTKRGRRLLRAHRGRLRVRLEVIQRTPTPRRAQSRHVLLVVSRHGPRHGKR